MLIETQNITKQYGDKTVVSQLNVQIPKGSLVAYLGTNGAGKSTTIKMLTGLTKPTSGRIVSATGIKIGIVFQDSVLDSELTVEANLNHRAGLYRGLDQVWLRDLFKLTGLQGLLSQKYGTLSGGQRRRVDIARALLNKPDLLFLDEPTTGLDVQTRQMIWELLYRLKQERGLTIFLTTHYLEEAENAEVTYVIDKGKILAQGKASDLIQQYAKNQLRLFLKEKRLAADLPYTMTETAFGYTAEGLTSQEALEVLESCKAVLDDFDFKRGTINEAFVAITGREIS